MDHVAHNAALRRKVRRKAVFGYGYLVTPGIAILGLALWDAIMGSRWLVFLVLAAVIAVFLFYLPLISHFRCANCRRFFHYQRMGLDGGDTVYQCIECGHTNREREWCGLSDIVKSSRSLTRRRF